MTIYNIELLPLWVNSLCSYKTGGLLGYICWGSLGSRKGLDTV